MEGDNLFLRPRAWARVCASVIFFGAFVTVSAQQPVAVGPELRGALIGEVLSNHTAHYDGRLDRVSAPTPRPTEVERPNANGAIELRRVGGLNRKHAALYWGSEQATTVPAFARSIVQRQSMPVSLDHGTFVAAAGGQHLALYKGSPTPVPTVVAARAAAPAAAPGLSASPWHYGGFIDAGYLLDFNHPANHLFRGSGTTWNVDRMRVNMAGVYVRKQAYEDSRWGIELTAHGGKDSDLLGTSPTAPSVAGFRFLRHLGPTNVSYLAPIGRGLMVQGGIFSSLIGYDSLYAKDGFEYTRSWGAAITPFLMAGVNASYPLTRKLTGTLFLINGYAHLAHANNVPSTGGQLAYAASSHLTLKETVLFGPHQTNTAARYWRSLSDTIVERKGREFTFAFEYIISAERVNVPGAPRALVMSGQLPVHWAINKHWSATVRPEALWDRDGRWTLARQTIRAVTTTLEYRVAYEQGSVVFRLEHRYDDSRGPDGGFFRGAEVRPGEVGLTPTQHLLGFGLIFTFDR
jgi:hypothetical protein